MSPGKYLVKKNVEPATNRGGHWRSPTNLLVIWIHALVEIVLIDGSVGRSMGHTANVWLFLVGAQRERTGHAD
jgi:hypothetical protein